MENIEEVQIKGYKCKECGQVYLNKDQAILCHKKYYCDICGKPTERYMLKCQECIDKDNYKKARKIAYEDYVKEFPDYMICDSNGNYYSEIEELIDDYYNDNLELPEYVYGCEKYRVEVDIENAICDAEENSELEDFNFDNTQELYDFVQKWNKENGVDAYMQNKKLIILYNKENYIE